jgi:hypothetical protein
MQIKLSDIDLDSFMMHPHKVGEHVVWLVQPQHIGVKWARNNLIFRSSVWDADGNPVSLSFQKFFNWDEQPDLTFKPFSLTANGGCSLLEKKDGSTLIVSKYKGHLIIRTRGTLDASKIDNGFEIEYLKNKYPLAFDLGSAETCDRSVIFEWTTPTNKIVINYGEEPDITLVGIINHSDYSLVSQDMLDKYAESIGVKRPMRYTFKSIKDMLAAVEAFKGQEGLCVYCNHDQNIRKAKSAWYLQLHHMKNEMGSYDRVVDAYFGSNTKTYTEFYDYIVNHFDFEIAEQCRGDISRICEGMKEVEKLMASMEAKVATVKNMPRKDAAGIIMQAYGNTNRSGMAFAILDGKPWKVDDIKKLLYQITKD